MVPVAGTFRKMPVIQPEADPPLAEMITTTDDPGEVENCHSLGCSNYITKPVDYDKFVKSTKQLGLFLMVVEVPKINGYSKIHDKTFVKFLL